MKNLAWDIWIYLARFYSGLLNAGMLLYLATMLTLHTGNLTRIPIAIMEGDWTAVLFSSVAILSYFMGCLATSYYYNRFPKAMLKEYWKGYSAVALLLIILWILPEAGWDFIVIMSMTMGIITSMPLPHRHYTGTITMMTGLITELAKNLTAYISGFEKKDKKQSIYLSLNLLSYVLGASLQAILTFYIGIVRAWPLLLTAIILAGWAYRFGSQSQDNKK